MTVSTVLFNVNMRVRVFEATRFAELRDAAIWTFQFSDSIGLKPSRRPVRSFRSSYFRILLYCIRLDCVCSQFSEEENDRK